MTTITQQSVTALTSILSDPDFVKLSSRARSTSVFEFLKIDELNTCSILAWLLDPKEGHAQGEYFVRALLSSLVGEGLDGDKELKLAKFLACSFSSFCVLQEVPISSGKTARRIDLLMLDVDTKKGICIERKDGTKAGRGQLQAYHDWCSRQYPDWEWVFVLSDSYERCHGGEAHLEFIQINDEWLVSALDNLVGRNAVPPEMEQIFRNLKSFVFGEWGEASDDYYKDFNKIIKQATSRHKDVLTELAELEFSNGFVAASTSKAEFYTNVLPKISGNLVETLFAKLWFSNLAALELLFEYNEFELIGESLQERVSRDLEYSATEKNLYLTNKKHTHFAASYWPYNLQVRRNDVEEGNEETVAVRLNVFNQNNDFTEMGERLASRYNLKTAEGWNQRSKPLLNSIPLKDFEREPDFLRCVREFLEITSDI